MSYINFNGKIFSSDKPVIKINNRAFCYGDALFETMKWNGKEINFINDHADRFFNGMRFLKMDVPKQFSTLFFHKQIFELIKKNKIIGEARIRLQVYRNEGGYYTPTDNSPSFVITAEKLNFKNYKLNRKGLTIDIFSGIKKTKSLVSNFKTSNSTIYLLAGIFAKENNLDDCLILNTDENITDSISSNVFIVKNKTLLTPTLLDGCVDGIMRKTLLKICKKEKIVAKEKSIKQNDLLLADEIFFTNVIQGIRWVRQFKKKNYSYDFSKYLFSKIIT